MSSQVRLMLLPSARCMFDEPIQVKVVGLRSSQVVTMRATSTDERGVVFKSAATYKADRHGEIDLNRDPSLSGSYVGLEPMGLLWSLRADALHKYFQKNKALIPHMVKISVHEEEEDRLLAEATNERILIGDGVSRVPVNEGNIRGILFTPPGAGPFPAVLDLTTRFSEKRASLLANKGFVVLTVTLFDKSLNNKEIHLEPFQEAAEFLLKQDKVGSKGVGVISRSKAGDIALSLATFVPGIEAVVWINGCNANMGWPLFYQKSQILPSLPFDANKKVPTESGAYVVKNILANPLAEENLGSLVPIQRAKARFLFVASGDDLNWDSQAYLEEMVERLQHHGKYNFERMLYPNAGHLLEPPYGPFCPSALHGFLPFPICWGGEPKAHTAAEVHLWKKIPEFFKIHLSYDDSQNKANL